MRDQFHPTGDLNDSNQFELLDRKIALYFAPTGAFGLSSLKIAGWPASTFRVPIIPLTNVMLLSFDP